MANKKEAIIALSYYIDMYERWAWDHFFWICDMCATNNIILAAVVMASLVQLGYGPMNWWAITTQHTHTIKYSTTFNCLCVCVLPAWTTISASTIQFRSSDRYTIADQMTMYISRLFIDGKLLFTRIKNTNCLLAACVFASRNSHNKYICVKLSTNLLAFYCNIDWF